MKGKYFFLSDIEILYSFVSIPFQKVKEANPINYILNKEYSNILVSLDSIS